MLMMMMMMMITRKMALLLIAVSSCAANDSDLYDDKENVDDAAETMIKTSHLEGMQLSPKGNYWIYG